MSNRLHNIWPFYTEETQNIHKCVSKRSGRREVVKAMFSGIVEERGSVSSLVKNDKVQLWDGSVGDGVELTVKAKTVLDGATEGCSIAVNGVCLTVTSFDDQEFKVNCAVASICHLSISRCYHSEASVSHVRHRLYVQYLHRRVRNFKLLPFSGDETERHYSFCLAYGTIRRLDDGLFCSRPRGPALGWWIEYSLTNE